MKKFTISNLVLCLLATFFLACGDSDSTDGGSNEWLIPENQVFDGGPGQDGIPSVDNPQFSLATETTYLNDNDLVVGVVTDTEVKAYPHPILDWHEIVNDRIGDLSLAITYCPLTGTAIAWDRMVNGQETTFGVSGKLYNTNLMPFDRRTESYWSQIRLDCVNGDLISQKINTSQVLETSWATWKRLYPESQVLTRDTGFDRQGYVNYPYQDYRTNNSFIIFPVSNLDERLPAKERVLGVFGAQTERAYSIELFDEPRAIYDEIDGTSIIVLGSKADNFVVAYEDNQDLEGLTINLDNDRSVAIASNGNEVTLSGEILKDGQRIGQLNPVDSYMAFYFSLGAFHPEIEVFE